MILLCFKRLNFEINYFNYNFYTLLKNNKHYIFFKKSK